MEKLGAVAKCAPPLRSTAVQEELWQCVLDGRVTTIGSDHSPSPPEMKQAVPGDQSDFFKLWGGIAGGQHTLELLLTRFPAHALPLLSQVTSFNVAKRFHLAPTKGALSVGADADLALVDLSREGIVRHEDLLDRHRLSPYVGRRLKGRVVRTILRGRTVAADGRIVSQPAGRLIKPTSK